MTDVFPALTLDAVCDLLLAAQRPLILSHARPDGDTIGSAAALCLFFARRGTPAAFACADPVPRRLGFLLEGVPLREPSSDPDTIIAVDVASPSQLGSLATVYAGRVSLMIDHHGTGTPFAPYWIRPDAAATGEVLGGIFRRLSARGDAPAADPDIAARLYAAVSSDTGCFRYANATPKTHRFAAALLATGIRADRINHALFEARSPEQLAAERIALDRLRLFEGGRIAMVTLTRADRGALADEYFETAIDVARSVAGVEIAVSLRETGPGIYRASLRSTDADVAAVAAALGGGGHLHAAGCTLQADSMESAVRLLLPRLVRAL